MDLGPALCLPLPFNEPDMDERSVRWPKKDGGIRVRQSDREGAETVGKREKRQQEGGSETAGKGPERVRRGCRDDMNEGNETVGRGCRGSRNEGTVMVGKRLLEQRWGWAANIRLTRVPCANKAV